MPTTYANLRDAVAAYMHRPADIFLVNGQDMLLRAINNAKNFAQRAVDFEQSRVFAELPNVSLEDGASIDDAVLFGTATPVILKTLKQAFLDRSIGGQFPIDIIGRDAYVTRLKRRFESIASVREANDLTVSNMFPLSMIQYGQTVFIVPADTNVLGSGVPTLYFDAIQWLPDFAVTTVTGTASSTVADKLVDVAKNFVSLGVRIGDVLYNTTDGTSAVVTAVESATTLIISANIMISGEAYSIGVTNAAQTNFLLEYCFDFMLFRTIFELNFFLKEDQRVPISGELLASIWDNVMKWNATIVGNVVNDTNLD